MKYINYIFNLFYYLQKEQKYQVWRMQKSIPFQPNHKMVVDNFYKISTNIKKKISTNI